MKKLFIILFSILGTLGVAIGGTVGYFKYDSSNNGFSEETYSICPDEQITLETYFDGELNWATDDYSIAKVNQKGVVTGVKKGTVTVTATSGLRKYTTTVIVRKHSFTEATCTKASVCEHCNSVSEEALGHEYTELTCTANSVCKTCGDIKEKATGHNFVDATCDEPSHCTKCGETLGVALGHQYDGLSCTEQGTCFRCGATSGKPLGHDFSVLTCTDDSVCSRCGEIGEKAPGHKVVEATCTTEKNCSVCNTKLAEPLGHNYQVASCTESGRCTRCGLASGQAVGHSYTEATCTDTSHCIRCGDVRSQALGHVYSPATCTKGAICERCGATMSGALGHDYQRVESGVDSSNRSYETFICMRCADLYTNYGGMDLSPEHLYDIMISFKASYPEGMLYTDKDYYGWNGGTYSGGYGCAGFAFMLSDACFGDIKARTIYPDYNDMNSYIASIRVGDILRVNGDTHSVIVLQKYSDGTCVFAEANYNSSVHWGRTASPAELAQMITYIMTRYP